MISTLGCSLAHEWQVEDGCYFSLSPITPPTVLTQAWGLLCFARVSVLCAHLPPDLPSSPQASLFSLKRPTADGGPCSDISTGSEVMGFFFVCMYTIAYVLRWQCEVFVCGGKSAIFRCANISFWRMILISSTSMHMSFSSPLTIGHHIKRQFEISVRISKNLKHKLCHT